MCLACVDCEICKYRLEHGPAGMRASMLLESVAVEAEG